MQKRQVLAIQFIKTFRNLLLWASLIGALSFFFFYNHTSLNVRSILQSIPKQDQERIELFFRILIHADSVGHTLFGRKPMSYIGIFNPEYIKAGSIEKFYSLHKDNLLFKIGFDTWLKYQHLFPSKNYLFITKKEAEFLEIFIINKKEFLNVVQRNLNHLCEKLGKNYSAEEFLDNFIKEKDASEFLRSQSVLGVLLGYGRENAELYERACITRKRNPYFGFSLRKPRYVPLSTFSSLEEELKFLEENFTSFPDNKMPNFPVIFMVPLGFGANLNSTETQMLKKQYQEEYRSIVQIYSGRDFLETTLERLIK